MNQSRMVVLKPVALQVVKPKFWRLSVVAPCRTENRKRQKHKISAFDTSNTNRLR